MNYIKQLQDENQALKDKLKAIEDAILECRIYYTSEKFTGFNNDYAHVSTDILPKFDFLQSMISM